MNYVRATKDSYQLTERRPAVCFEEAYPIGNGFQGAMVYGGVEREKISLNDDTLWTGYPREDRYKGEGKIALERAGKAILNGDYISAHRDITQNFSCYASDAYLPLGELIMDRESFSEKVSGYKRTLDLSKAVFKAEYKLGGVKHSVTSFASNPDRVIAYRIEAKNSDGTPASEISFTVGMSSQLYSRTYTQNGLLLMEGECHVSAEQNISRTERKTQYYDEPEKRGMRFVAMADIITDGKKGDRLNAISVRDASFCEIRIFTATSFNGYKKHPYTDGRDYLGICKTIDIYHICTHSILHICFDLIMLLSFARLAKSQLKQRAWTE